MSHYRHDIGEYGEQLAMESLQKQGYTILFHHYTTHWAEIDIIAQRGTKISFVEVKTRVGEAKGKPWEAVDYYKLKALRRAIQLFLTNHPFRGYKYSLEVCSIVLDSRQNLLQIKWYDTP